MFITSLFAATMPSHASPIIGIMSVTLIFSISFLWYTLVAYVFSLSQFRDIYRKIGLWLERCAGVLFIGFGMKLATSK